ncbi:uncharacterized protein LOC134454242 [Engraulis encrasicolus]|uniref:uncharacterized protein LOC134454242 n=1 Tax=Engraulis encrasicolus TaxID=184585 RepID=UPI002FD4B078
MFLSGGLVALLVFGLLIMTFRLMKIKHKRTAQTPSGNTGEDCHVYSEIRDPTPLDLNTDPDETSSSTAVYSLATPADPIGLQQFNQNQESTPDIYTLVTNLTTVSPSETISVVNQDAGSKTDIYSLATNLKPLDTTLVTNQDCDSKPDIYSLATNPTPALNTSCLSLKADQSAEIEGGIYCNLELAEESESVAFTDGPNDSSVSVCFTKTPAGPK